MRARQVVAIGAAATVLLVLALPTRAAEPLRSGRIVTGVAPSGQWDVDYDDHLDGCMAAPECVAWRTSGCSPSLAGRDPAVDVSIVDVADLADGETQRRFDLDPNHAGLAWGWVVVEFASADCMPITHRSRIPKVCGDAECPPDVDRYTVVIPQGARWMAISSRHDNINVAWTLS